MMHETDEELIQKLINHDETAFDELYRRYEKRLYDLAYRLSSNDADAKDAVQDTFYEVHRSIHTLREPKYFSLWIRKVLLSKIKTIFAKNKDMVLPDHDYRFLNHLEENKDFLPIDHMHYESDQLQLQDFINQLAPHYREVLILTYFEHLKNQEISELLDVPIGTVKSRLNMARSILKQNIETYEKKNNVKLDFHGDVLAACLLQGGIATLLPKHKGSFFHGSHIMAGGFTSIVKFVACVVLLGGGSMAVASYMDQRNDSESSKQYQNTMAPTTKKVSNETNFTPVTLDGKTYQTPYQAYLAIKEYMHCTYELEQATSEQLNYINNLYVSLKEEHGVYYNLLEKQGWINKFEKLSNHSYH